MKYIILCGSNHALINGVPRQLVTIKGERILDRTIRLLRENGVTDISITATDPAFTGVNADIIQYDSGGHWVNAFPLVDEPACFIFGDVFFSPAAIKTIVNTQTDDVEFFGSTPPFAPNYPKHWAEPFAFKVVNIQHFRDSIKEIIRLKTGGVFSRDPISWELWQVIKGTPLNKIIYNNYTAINDYTCDVDEANDVTNMERML